MMEILSQVKNSCKSVAASQCCCSTPLLLLSIHPQRQTECIWDIKETTSLSVLAFCQGNCQGIFIHTNATHCILLLIRYILGKPKRWWVVKILLTNNHTMYSHFELQQSSARPTAYIYWVSAMWLADKLFVRTSNWTPKYSGKLSAPYHQM